MGYNNKRMRYDNYTYTGPITRSRTERFNRPGMGGNQASFEAVRKLVDQAAQTKYGQSFTENGTKKDISGQGITAQRDSSLIYQRKRAPYAIRRKARRSIQDFKRKILSLKGSRTFFTNSVFTSSAAANKQSITSWVLYGGRVDGAVSGAIDRGYDDMNDLREKDYLLGDNTGDAERRWSEGDAKWYIKTAVLDCTLENTSTGTVPIEVDIYEFTCKKLSSLAGTDVETALDYYADPDTYLPGASAAGLQILQLDTRGVTPFEYGPSMQKMGFKILKKTKYFVPKGDSITYQIRDTNIRTMTHQVFRDESCTTYCTRGILVISKPTAGQSTSASQYIMGCTRKYKYVVDESNASRAGQFNPKA